MTSNVVKRLRVTEVKQRVVGIENFYVQYMYVVQKIHAIVPTCSTLCAPRCSSSACQAGNLHRLTCVTLWTYIGMAVRRIAARCPRLQVNPRVVCKG